jgi:hypothetical protein
MRRYTDTFVGLGIVVLAVACSDSSTSPGGMSGSSGTTSGSTTGGATTTTGGTTSSTSATTGTGGATGAGGSGGAGGASTTAATGGGAGTGGTGGTGGAGGAAGSSGAGGSAGTGGATDAGSKGGAAGGSSDAGGTMSFFVTSTGSGAMGGNLGGLAGADAKCQMLATAAGAGGRTWHAYLSISGATPIHARERIGMGPWFNSRGVMIAASLAQLHDEGGMNALGPTVSLDETGAQVPTNQHDILTGTAINGNALPAAPDLTCGGWMSNAANVMAQVGHENRTGTGGNPPTSWNSAHSAVCTMAGLVQVGGAGRLYCFATN